MILETLLSFHITTWRQNAKEHEVNFHHREKLIPRIVLERRGETYLWRNNR